MPVMDEPLDTSDPPASPHVLPTQLSAEQILAATARCLREEGYDATTIRRIAGRLDCAVGSIYRYYTDKRELLDAVAQAALEPAARIVDAGGSVEESAAMYHRLAADDPALYRMMFWISALGAGPGISGGNGHGSPPTARRTPRVIERIIRGWGRRLGDEPAAHACWVALHGCVTLGLSEAASIDLLRAVLKDGAPALTRTSDYPSLPPAPPSPMPAKSNGHADGHAQPVVVMRSVAARRRTGSAAAKSAAQPAEPAEDLVLL